MSIRSNARHVNFQLTQQANRWSGKGQGREKGLSSLVDSVLSSCKCSEFGRRVGHRGASRE